MIRHSLLQCHVVLAALLIGGLAKASASAEVEAAQGWAQDKFAIGSFLDPPADDYHYSQLRAANFTVMLSTYTTSASTMAAQAAMCKAHDLKCILSGPTTQFPKRDAAMHDCKGRVDPDYLYEPAAPLPSHIWGYYLWDEPYENRTDQPRLDMYEWLRSVQDAVHAKQPNALVYINGGDGSSESTTFDAAYDKAVQPDVYSFDFYPSFGGRINNVSIEDSRGVQLRLLEEARLVSQARGVPMWCDSKLTLIAMLIAAPISLPPRRLPAPLPPPLLFLLPLSPPPLPPLLALVLVWPWFWPAHAPDCALAGLQELVRRRRQHRRTLWHRGAWLSV